MSQSYWEASLEDADGNTHIWKVYREFASMMIAAGFPQYEQINAESGCFVLVDSAKQKIKAVMGQGWKEVTKQDALDFMAQGAGRKSA